MNILIFGNKASGKTLLVNFLKDYYEQKGHKVNMFDEENCTDSRKDYERNLKIVVKSLVSTLGKEDKHTLITTQGIPSQIYGFYKTEERPRLYDYYYNTIKY